MKFKSLSVVALLVGSVVLSGCQSNADSYAADVYDTSQLNEKQETKTITIISVLPAKIAVDNTKNKQAAQAVGTILGAVVGGAVGYNVGSGGSVAGTSAGAVGGGTLGAVAGSMVGDKTLVEGVSLTYQENNKVYTSTQVGRPCQFAPGLAVVITTKANETRVQPNATCPEPKK